MRERDRNTKFFHLSASSRRRGNLIDKLLVQGNMIEEPKDIKEAIAVHFERHFNHCKAFKIREWSCNLNTLSEDSSVLLERSFSEEEVWDVISRSDGNKAPSPDGFNMHFIKNHWSLIKKDVMRFFANFFESDTFDKRLNASFIALIPTCFSPSSLDQYRLISLV